jgi:hypothetical protein
MSPIARDMAKLLICGAVPLLPWLLLWWIVSALLS